MTLSITMLCHYAECRVILIVMLSAIMLNVIRLSVIMLNVVMLNVIMLSAIMLNVIRLSVVRLRVVRLRFIMLDVIRLSVIMLSVVMLSVVAPTIGQSRAGPSKLSFEAVIQAVKAAVKQLSSSCQNSRPILTKNSPIIGIPRVCAIKLFTNVINAGKCKLECLLISVIYLLV
jgi:hypothetical protein